MLRVAGLIRHDMPLMFGLGFGAPLIAQIIERAGWALPFGAAALAVGEALKRIGRPDVLLDAAIYNLVFYGILFALAWSGYAIETALLWWLPRPIGMTYIQ